MGRLAAAQAVTEVLRPVVDEDDKSLAGKGHCGKRDGEKGDEENIIELPSSLCVM